LAANDTVPGDGEVAGAMSAASFASPLSLATGARPAAGEREALGEDDRATVEAARKGDRAAFDVLVERYERDVYRLCYRYVGDHQDASDMVQEAFLKAYRAIGRFRGDSAFSTWLYRIAVNTCLNFRAGRRPPSAEIPENLPDKRPGALRSVLDDERSRAVQAAVSRLPEKQRATVILKIFHELSHEEVAKALGSSVGTAKANLFHALGNLRKLLQGAME
jgi:RNA polymerase sigma-70 factor (ECF subfamily)